MNSLNRRLSVIETNLSGLHEVDERQKPEENVMDFESVLVKHVKDKKKRSQHSKLDHIKEKYRNSIARNLNTDDIKDEIFNLIKLTIIFTEKYGPRIAEIISTAVTGEFKLTTCLSLVREYVHSSDYTDSFITNTIDSLVSLIFNTRIVIPKDERKEEKKDEKEQDFKSIESLPVIQEKPILKRSKSIGHRKVRFWN
jgi:hypothetical protein